MTSKASLSDKLIHKGFFFSDLKRFWWVSALYTIALFLILPVYHFLQGTSEENKWAWEGLKYAINLSQGNSEFQLILIYFVPVFLAVLLFLYLHSGRATATIHSLPLTRKQLFYTHSAAGLVLLTIPVVFTGLALMAVRQMTLLRDVYAVGNVLSWMGYTWLFAILFFAIAVFVGMFTGNPLTHAVFTYILIALPMGLYELLRYNLSLLLFGYSNAALHQNLLDSLPIYALLSDYVGEGSFTGGHIVGALLLIAITFALALYAYRARKLEAAGDVVTFSIVRPIFKYGVTICTMLLVGAYFASVSGRSLAIVVFGYLFGSFLGYFIAEMLLKKSFRIWHQGYKGYLAYALILVVTLVGIQGDVFGFVHKVPAPEEVEEVYFGPSIYTWVEMNSKSLDKDPEASTEHYYQGTTGWFFKSPQNIEHLSNLHSQIVLEENPEGNSNQFIIYTLKNGKNLIRQYSIDETKFFCLLKPIYESSEYKEARFPVLRQSAKDVKMIELNDSRTPKEPLILATDGEISELMEALRKDIKNLTFKEMSIWKQSQPELIIRDMNDRRIDYAVRDSYISTLQWLKEKGYLEQTILQPQEVEYVMLTRHEEIGSSFAKVELRDAELIKELLEKCGRSNLSKSEEEIVLHFYVKNNSGVYEFLESIFKDTSVSPELKQYLEKII